MQKDLFATRRMQHDSILEEVAGKHDVEVDLLKSLIDYEQGRVHLKKRRGARNEIKRQIEESLTD